MLKKILIGLGVVVAGILVWYFIYVQIYKMDVIDTSEINKPDLDTKVLIASQGSEFKNTLVEKLTNDLKSKPCYIKIVDATTLADQTCEGWNAVVILHTTEWYKAPKAVHTFLDNARDLGKVFLVTTAGDEETRLDYTVDAVTSSSVMEEIDAISKKVLDKINTTIPAAQPDSI